MSLALDLYVPGRSWLHRLDPRVKLWATFLGIAVAFLLPGPLEQALFLVFLHLLLRVAGVPWHLLGWLWRQMGLLALFILILQPFFSPSGPSLVTWGSLHLTVGGIEAALGLALRAVAMAFVAAGLLFTTDQGALVQGLVRLGVPYTWGLTLSLTLRFLPAINGLFLSIREAQAARGWVAEGNFLRRARGYLPVLVAVVIGTLRLSDQLTLALAARGLGISARRTTWHELRMRSDDWWCVGGVTALFVLFLVRRLWSGI
ncbi:MAG: energy-coupling factor transporter transmembrane component T [Anaerolineae bacterium]|jgi:energy-coupling factor transport system permease protein|nr:energy-coupling factor transporter transmembrane component T [Anaerolineae bacterium]